MFLSALFPSIKRRKREETIERLYGAIVAQAREPIFYCDFGVPDTLEGRFDLLVLHVHLVFRRLRSADEASRAIGQGVFDRFIFDMDASLREIGVGDLAVPKRMRAMGEAFYGRASAYDGALTEGDDEALAASLLRNVYSGNEAFTSGARQLARYVRKLAAILDEQDAEAIAAGNFRFPTPEGVVAA